MRYITPVIKWGKEVGPKVWSRTKETSGKVKQYTTDAFSKMHQSKQWQTASKSIGELKAKSISIGSKVEKHVKRHPIKYTAAGAGVTGFGFAKTHSGQEKKLKAYFGTLPKSDPRYKIMKEKGWV